MIEGLVSVLSITWERFETTKRCMTATFDNMENCAPIQWLVADQGSKDCRVVDWVAQHPFTVYHRKNSRNEGVSHSLNQLYLRSQGEYIAFVGTDIENSKGWLKELIRYCNSIPEAGLIGLDWGHGGVPPLTEKFDILAHWLNAKLNRVFGSFMCKRSLIEKIGLFGEDYGPYGLEDSAFNERVIRSGFNSCYVPNSHFRSTHRGVGTEDSGEYRAMKNASLSKNTTVFGKQIASWDQGGSLVEPLPEARESI